MSVIAYIEENLPKTIRANRDDIGSLLGLPYPYTVPCPEDKFLEMYYWDTYFTNIGLIADGKIELAKNNIDNMLYMVEKYGFMPNGNRTYYLNRSQPPFLYLGVRDIFNETKDIIWLENAYRILCKEYEFWQTERLAPNGLNFYGNHNNISQDRVEILYNDFTKRSGGYTTDDCAEKVKIAHTIMSFVESGWDCNSRFGFDGEFINPIDLNSLLYGFENQMADFSKILKNGMNESWINQAEKRKELMNKYMWNDEKSIYMDWNFCEKKFSPVISAASIYPLYVKLCDNAKGTLSLLNELTLQYGVSASLKENTNGYQWDYPNIWPPVQYIAYVSAKNYNCDDFAENIKEKYLTLIEQNFNKTNNLWEKYDGTNGEVANQDYNAPKMLGWTAGVYLYFAKDK